MASGRLSESHPCEFPPNKNFPFPLRNSPFSRMFFPPEPQFVNPISPAARRINNAKCIKGNKNSQISLVIPIMAVFLFLLFTDDFFVF